MHSGARIDKDIAATYAQMKQRAAPPRYAQVSASGCGSAIGAAGGFPKMNTGRVPFDLGSDHGNPLNRFDSYR